MPLIREFLRQRIDEWESFEQTRNKLLELHRQIRRMESELPGGQGVAKPERQA
jgi:hypothetical protein